MMKFKLTIDSDGNSLMLKLKITSCSLKYTSQVNVIKTPFYSNPFNCKSISTISYQHVFIVEFRDGGSIRQKAVPIDHLSQTILKLYPGLKIFVFIQAPTWLKKFVLNSLCINAPKDDNLKKKR